MEKILNKKLAIYQAKDGAIEFRLDNKQDTIWATQSELCFLYGKDQSVISRHVKNIFSDKEILEKSNMQKVHIANSDKPVVFYSLDIILAVGYRTNSSQAIQFRKWATKTLKDHITKGYTVNKKVLQKNYDEFLKTVEDIKLLSKNNQQISSDNILNLIKVFSSTWFSLKSYDKQNFPKKGKKKSKKKIVLGDLSKDLYNKVVILKENLIKEKQATDLFAQEKKKGNLEGILGNVLQSIFGQDAYETVEEKASHLLYFIIKNHPFNDGNKRTGAFSFVWFLQKMNFDFREKISPETLTALTLLIAESNPKDKEKMIGLVLLLLQK